MRKIIGKLLWYLDLMLDNFRSWKYHHSKNHTYITLDELIDDYEEYNNTKL